MPAPAAPAPAAAPPRGAAVFDPEDVRVAAASASRRLLDYSHPLVAEALAAAVPRGGPRGGRPFRFHLAPLDFSVDVEGVPTAVANALRAAIVDHLPGRCLSFDPVADLVIDETTDPFCRNLINYLLLTLRQVPLRYRVTEAEARTLRFAIDAANPGPAPRVFTTGDLRCTAGHLTAPLLAPTIELFTLQPGTTLRVNNIFIAEGVGRVDAAFNVAVRARSVPLDLAPLPKATPAAAAEAARRAFDTALAAKEALAAAAAKAGADADAPAPPEAGDGGGGGGGKKDGDAPGGPPGDDPAARAALDPVLRALYADPTAALKRSGYAESCFVANPRRHRISAALPAVGPAPGAASTVLSAGCDLVRRRLGRVASIADQPIIGVGGEDAAAAAAPPPDSDSHFLIVDDPDTPDRLKGTLTARGLGHLTGNLLTRLVYETFPGVSYVGYRHLGHKDTLTVTLCHQVAEPSELVEILLAAVRAGRAAFARIQRGARELLLDQ